VTSVPAEPATWFTELTMRPNEFAQIAIRTLSLFLGYKSIEFGISMFIQAYYSLQLIESAEGQASQAIHLVRMMLLMSTLVPLGLAVAMWFSAPWLSHKVVSGGEEQPTDKFPVPLRDTLVQVAGIVLIGVAVARIPQIAYDFQNARRRDPTVGLMATKSFPDVLLLLGNAFVGAGMLLVVKKRVLGGVIDPGSGSVPITKKPTD